MRQKLGAQVATGLSPSVQHSSQGLTVPPTLRTVVSCACVRKSVGCSMYCDRTDSWWHVLCFGCSPHHLPTPTRPGERGECISSFVLLGFCQAHISLVVILHVVLTASGLILNLCYLACWEGGGGRARRRVPALLSTADVLRPPSPWLLCCVSALFAGSALTGSAACVVRSSSSALECHLLSRVSDVAPRRQWHWNAYEKK